MLAVSQWQPTLGVCPKDTVYFQALRSHPPFPNSEPLYTNFNKILSSGSRGASPEVHLPQVISEMQDTLPNFPSVTADMLPDGRRVPTSEDWEFYRPTIIQLYRDEDRSLKDVMEMMRTQHNFNATVKMYKSRLATWGVRKYMTWAERETACRVMKLKQGAGDRFGNVIVRGKQRNLDVFLRHMGHSRAGTRRKQLLMNGGNLEDIIIDTIKRNDLQPRVCPTMYPAGPQRSIEIVCKEMSSLILNMLPPGQIGTGEFVYFLLAGNDRFEVNRLVEVRVLLNRAANWYDGNIGADPATALLAVLHSREFTVASSLSASELLVCFHRHLLDLTSERYGPQHSVTKLLMHILRTESDLEITQHMWRGVLTMTISSEKERGAYDLSPWYRRLADSFECSKQFGKAERLLLDAVNSFDGETSGKDPAKLGSSFDLAWHYIVYQQGKDDEAERILIDIHEAGTDEITGEVDPYHAHFAYTGMGQLAAKRGEEEAAISFYRLCIQAAYEGWGPESNAGLEASIELADYLRRLGREQEALEAESLMRLTDEFSELDIA